MSSCVVLGSSAKPLTGIILYTLFHLNAVFWVLKPVVYTNVPVFFKLLDENTSLMYSNQPVSEEPGSACDTFFPWEEFLINQISKQMCQKHSEHQIEFRKHSDKFSLY